MYATNGPRDAVRKWPNHPPPRRPLVSPTRHSSHRHVRVIGSSPQHSAGLKSTRVFTQMYMNYTLRLYCCFD